MVQILNEMCPLQVIIKDERGKSVRQKMQFIVLTAK